jgi:hypothetical protein
MADDLLMSFGALDQAAGAVGGAIGGGNMRLARSCFVPMVAQYAHQVEMVYDG